MLVVNNSSLKSKSSKKLNVLRVALLGTLAITACGKQQGSLVKDVQVRTYVNPDNQAMMAELKATLATGNLGIPAVTLPILNPQQPGEVYGRVGLKPALGGGSELTLDVDVTRASGLQGGAQATLPNGSAIPVGGLGDTPVIGLDVGSYGRVYVAVGQGVALLGAALTIPQFDAIGSQVPLPVNLFPSFQMANGIRGVAGIFTGMGPGKSGVAIFADVSAVLKQGAEQTLARHSVFELRAADGIRIRSDVPSRLRFFSPSQSAEAEYRVKAGLYQLNRKRVRIDVR